MGLYAYELQIEDVIKEEIKIVQTNNPSIYRVLSKILKSGVRAYKIAYIYEIVDANTGEFHHYQLHIKTVTRTIKNGYEISEKNSISLSEKDDEKEIEELLKFLIAYLSGELSEQTENCYIVDKNDFNKLEKFKKEDSDILLEIIDKITGIETDILKKFMSKLSEEEKTDKLIETLSEIELENLSVAYKYKNLKNELENLKKLLELEEKGNIVNDIKNYEELKVYQAGQPEKIFQNWIEKNIWVFGIEYIRKHDVRKIALFSEGDILMESLDGFMDLIELKRANYELFNYDSSHKCYYPSPKLSQVIGQSLFYLQKIDDYKLNLEKEYKFKIIRPRIKIVAGRSNNFEDEQLGTLRMINSNLNSIQIITYDFIISSGEIILNNLKSIKENKTETELT